MRVWSILTVVLLQMISPLRWSRIFLALVMSSKPFSTLPMICSPSPIVKTKVFSPRRKAKPSFFGCWKWILMKPAQFRLTVLIPISIGLEYVVPNGMFTRRSLSVHAVFTSRRLSVLDSPSNLMVTWNPW